MATTPRPPKAARVQRPTSYVPADQHTLAGFQNRLKAYAKAAEAQAKQTRGKVTQLPRNKRTQGGQIDTQAAGLYAVALLLASIALGVAALLLKSTGNTQGAALAGAAGLLFFLAALGIIWRDIQADHADTDTSGEAFQNSLAPESQPSPAPAPATAYAPVIIPDVIEDTPRADAEGVPLLDPTEQKGREQFFWQPQGRICRTCSSVRVLDAHTAHPSWRCWDGGFPTAPAATCPYWSEAK